jgi:hypothetical protein
MANADSIVTAKPIRELTTVGSSGPMDSSEFHRTAKCWHQAPDLAVSLEASYCTRNWPITPRAGCASARYAYPARDKCRSQKLSNNSSVVCI